MSCGSPEFSNCSFEKCNLLNHFKSEKETSLRHWWSYNIAFDIIYLTESFARFCHFVKSQRTIYNNQRSAIHHKFGSILERLKNNDSVFWDSWEVSKFSCLYFNMISKFMVTWSTWTDFFYWSNNRNGFIDHDHSFWNFWSSSHSWMLQYRTQLCQQAKWTVCGRFQKWQDFPEQVASGCRAVRGIRGSIGSMVSAYYCLPSLPALPPSYHKASSVREFAGKLVHQCMTVFWPTTNQMLG